jgi:tetratricopeptide (TPR) repeat protein
MPVSRAATHQAPEGPQKQTKSACTKAIGGALLLTLLIFLAYSNTLQAPLIFDDIPSISKNESIKHLATAFSPPRSGETVTGRPVLNASFALNYALTGASVAGFHVTNILIHVLAALTLWGVLRRTLDLPYFRNRFEGSSGLVAWIASALWALHPLQTESVTYTAQRAESLVGLFYLLTLYAFIRSRKAGARRGWSLLAWIACLAGMGSKEVMATAPVILLLYDRTFLSGTFRESLRKNGRLLTALAGTWLLLGFLVAGNLSRNNTVGFGGAVNGWTYLSTQSYALVRYLILSIYPTSLTLDYGILVVKETGTLVLCGAVVTVLIAATCLGLVRRPRDGFFGAWFFVILAPTSSVIPIITQTVAEHRMYLPLAAITTAVTLLIWPLGTKIRTALLVVLVLAAGFLTWQRNQTYRSPVSIWEDTAAKRPQNPRALNNLGMIYGELNRFPEAIKLFVRVLELDPTSTETNYNLAYALARVGRDEESIKYFQAAIAAKPDNIDALANFGAALQRLGRFEEAIAQNKAALRLDRRLAEAHYNLGLALMKRGRAEEGLEHLRASSRLAPNDAGYLTTFVTTLAETGHRDEAIAVCENYLQHSPTADGYTFLGVLYGRSGRLEKARDAFRAAVRIEPQNSEANANLARANALLERAETR